MQLTVIGYLGGLPAHGDATSCFLLTSGDYNLLLDCGSGALLALQKIISPLKLDAVLLTHFHADHIADVGVLQHYWQLVSGQRKTPRLPIYASNHDLVNYNRLDWPNATVKQAIDFENGIELGPFKCTFFKTKHPVETFAVRIKEDGNPNELVYTADTTVIAGLATFAKGAKVLLADTNFLANQPEPRWHLTTNETATLATDANIEEIILTHLPPFGDEKLIKTEVVEQVSATTKVTLAQTGLQYII